MTPDGATIDSEARSRASSLEEARRDHEMLASCRRYISAAVVIWCVVGVIEVIRGWDSSEVAVTIGLYRAATVAFALVPGALLMTRTLERRWVIALMGLFVATFGASLLAMCAVDRGRAEIYPFRILVLAATMGTTLPFRARTGVGIQLAHAGLTLLLFGGLAAALPDVRAALGSGDARRDVLGAVPLMLTGSALAVWIGDWSWHNTQAWLRTTDLGRYTLRHKLGMGGMGEVWVAWHGTMRRLVALKILRLPKGGTSATAAARFDREIHATASLSHPNTVRIFDHGITDDGLPYYTMELLEGASLGATVRQSGPLEPARVQRLMGQVARALGEAHGKGIVHRDLKPDNLFIANAGGEVDFAKVLDFGIAQIEDQAPTATEDTPEDSTPADLTAAGMVPGTPTFMAPEVARGAPADPRSDVYALGVTMYFALTGTVPFRAKSATAVIEAHASGPLVDVNERSRLPVPPAFAAVVMRCLATDPADRYDDARRLSYAIEAAS